MSALEFWFSRPIGEMAAGVVVVLLIVVGFAAIYGWLWLVKASRHWLANVRGFWARVWSR